MREGINSSPQKNLAGGKSKNTSVDVDKLKSRTNEVLEKLRQHEEIQAIEQEHGKIKLTFDQSEDTGIVGNTVNINASRLNQSYAVDIDGSKAAYFGLEKHNSLSDGDFDLAINKFEQSLTEYHQFSLERTLVHEINHLLDPPGCTGVCYGVNKHHIESSVIQRTNKFMMKHFNEPYRVLDHGAVVNQ